MKIAARGLQPLRLWLQSLSKGTQQFLLKILAYVSLGFAFLGLITPGLPATEFLLLSAWAAGKSSPRLQQWMLNHKMLGPALQNWQSGGYLSRKIKWFSSSAMLLSFTLMVLFVPHLWLIVITGLGMTYGAWWIWQRPELKPE